MTELLLYITTIQITSTDLYKKKYEIKNNNVPSCIGKPVP
jgi:hypothetical protein